MNQTYRNIEILCIDDCGEDDSIKIVENYAKRIRERKIQDTQKIRARTVQNFGISEAKGHFIFFLDL